MRSLGNVPERLAWLAKKIRMVPAQGFEPWTIGLKASIDLRGTAPDGSPGTRNSALRLLVAPQGSPAWQYQLAINPKALSDRPAPANAKREGPSHLAPSGDSP